MKLLHTVTFFYKPLWRAKTLYTTKLMYRNTITVYIWNLSLFLPLLLTYFYLYSNDHRITFEWLLRLCYFSIDLLWYLCVLVICSCWQYGCTPQLASDKQYRLQAQLAHVVSRIDILFYFFFKYTAFLFRGCYQITSVHLF